MINKKPCQYNPTIEASDKRQKTKNPTHGKQMEVQTKSLLHS